MSDVKISQLPATTGLDGTELVPLVDGGVDGGVTMRATATEVATPAINAHKVDPAAHSGTYVPLQELALFPPAVYGSIQAALTAAGAAGGGTVPLSNGANPVSTTLYVPARVTLSGPEGFVWSVWGYLNTGGVNDPRLYHSCWLEADGTAGPVVRFGPSQTNASIRNVMIMANGRIGVSCDDWDGRGGTRIDNVYVNSASVGLYVGVGQKEIRIHKLLVERSSGDGIQINAQDCEMTSSLSQHNGGNGLVLGIASGPLRLSIIDASSNTLAGVVIDGHNHKLACVQTDGNLRQGVIFRETTGSRIHDLQAATSGREFLTSAIRYPDVEFAHPTGGNLGCAIIGGTIEGDGIQSHAVKTTEAAFSLPRLVGVKLTGEYNGDATESSPFNKIDPLSNILTSGCHGVPDLTTQQGGLPPRTRPFGAGDLHQYTDGSNVLAGFASGASLYLPVSTQTLSSNGAVTINAALGNTAVVTLAANATSSSITNPKLGQQLTIQWLQDGVGGRTYVWPTNCVFADAAPRASTAIAARDSATFIYDGTNWQQIAKARTDFSYRVVASGRARLDAQAAATLGLHEGGASGPTGSSGGLVPVYLDPADWPSTAKLRVKLSVLTNDVAPTVTFTVGLYPITTPGGGAAIVTAPFGTVIAGSTAVVTTPALDTKNVAVSTDFTPPAAGWYSLGLVTTTNMAVSSAVAIRATLEAKC